MSINSDGILCISSPKLPWFGSGWRGGLPRVSQQGRRKSRMKILSVQCPLYHNLLSTNRIAFPFWFYLFPHPLTQFHSHSVTVSRCPILPFSQHEFFKLFISCDQIISKKNFWLQWMIVQQGRWIRNWNKIGQYIYLFLSKCISRVIVKKINHINQEPKELMIRNKRTKEERVLHRRLQILQIETGY